MDTDRMTGDIGRRLKDLRKQNGLTQQELADRAELTKGFISQLERGQVTPSLVTLMDLIEILGTTPGDFFKDTGSMQVVFREKDYCEKVDDDGNVTEWLVPAAQGNQMEPLHVALNAHAALALDEPHSGEEFGYVLSGRISLYRGDSRFDVKAGESFYYKADCPHRIVNPGNRTARFIWVSTPPSF